MGRGLNVPLTVSGVGEPGGVCLVLENVEPLVDDSVRVVSLVADGEERKSVRVRALPHAPLRETVPVLTRVVEVDVVVVAGGGGWRVRHAEVGQTVLSDGEQRVQQHVGLVRVIKLPVPPHHEDPPDQVLQRHLRPPVGLQGTPGAVI